MDLFSDVYRPPTTSPRPYFDPSRGIQVGDVYRLSSFATVEFIRRVKHAAPFIGLVTIEGVDGQGDIQNVYHYTRLGHCLFGNGAYDIPRQPAAHLSRPQPKTHHVPVREPVAPVILAEQGEE